MSLIFWASFIFADLGLKWKMPRPSNTYSGLLSDLQTGKMLSSDFFNKIILFIDIAIVLQRQLQDSKWGLWPGYELN